MRRSADFDFAFQGTRGGAKRLAVALNKAENRAGLPMVKVGFVVSKKVGNSVVRHRLARQLRHIIRAKIDELSQLGEGIFLVIRALPAAHGASAKELEADLDVALSYAVKKLERKSIAGQHSGAPCGDRRGGLQEEASQARKESSIRSQRREQR